MRECQLCKHCFSDTVTTCPNDGMPTAHTIAGEPVLEGKYLIELRLGQGGMGVVYKARHAYLKTMLAIKVILPDLVGNDPELVTRFRQEALAAAAIRHTNVVGVTDYGVINGSIPFLVMEYVEGESLHDLLARENKLSPERALELITPICAGVGAAHHQGIVHRDLKPLNVMICSDKPNLSQAVKILDFGLAKIKSGELLGSFIQAQTTGLMGSPYYMAPEQWADEDPDSRADIYSLGVMLYQMLAGDVPFKGSSIPAIMKKHISDPPPTFASLGTDISPELERAVFHTLEKDPAHRTESVEALVEEMRAAIYPNMSAIHSTASQTLPVSSLRIRTKPPESKVYVDNIAVGATTNSGLLLLDGIQSGNHLLRVSKDGFQDWVGDVVCDGKPVEIVAELRGNTLDPYAIPRPTMDALPTAVPRSEAATAPHRSMSGTPELDATMIQQPQQTGQGFVASTTIPPKKGFFSPLVLGIIGILVLSVIGIAGLGAAYMLGAFGGSGEVVSNGNTKSPTPVSSPAVVPKAEMVMIPGGTFKMGRSDGPPESRPEHQVDVKSFWMDKSEVTNAEYFAFVSAVGYKPVPVDWVNDKPIAGQEQWPVRFVNVEDAKAFAAWRSKNDGKTYRLPTEEEWEYAARNGAKNNLYPWGDSYRAECAVVDQSNTEPKPVGSKSCPNAWGVIDLIGNVFEWTSSPVSLYPGSKGEIKPTSEKRNMIRGGAALNKSSGDFGISATYRVDVDVTKRDKELGFRLVCVE
ncbi:MAG: SUMF1/EgtB/PvdO family nonheme iron enzyme [Pyrinomonadaceae bacterium]|nr:SUMF1/EgtB/PvdO family nonheme iron enzyme [Pyrinomonadaceae bacterium]MBP6212395.1 SUMF1/EgtB/PvdO family nonheme iron enzyme [Pyrinomonadaceae bacterium]